MNRRMSHWLGVAIAAVFVLAVNRANVYAADDVNVVELKKQIETLQKRVDQLEAEKRNAQDNRGQSLMSRSRALWEPFEEMERMQQEMNLMFQNAFDRQGQGGAGMFNGNMGFNTDFDLKDTGRGYEIKIDIAGLDRNKINLEINPRSITVKGEYGRQESHQGGQGFYSARSFGTLVKTIALPVDADTTQIKTDKQGDVLLITLPKKHK
ncbi:MAG: Hsp20/alpha crystallin family protein [Candidatus Omnitrophica bacterium]|nr:Hsp20/alpha crystallin family protein [Candidatus Omnitrophota bacterium]